MGMRGAEVAQVDRCWAGVGECGGVRGCGTRHACRHLGRRAGGGAGLVTPSPGRETLVIKYRVLDNIAPARTS